MALFDGAPDQVAVQTHLEFFVATSSQAQVSRFVAKTRGKHFEVTGDVSAPRVELRDGPPPLRPQTRSCCRCWRPWAASFAYFYASGMTCSAVTAGAGPLAGFMCGGVFWGIENLPNFDNACR